LKQPRPVIWKPRYPTRVMRERAWAKADLARERAAAGDTERPRLLTRLRRRFR
jgi:hypothetical protein